MSKIKHLAYLVNAIALAAGLLLTINGTSLAAETVNKVPGSNRLSPEEQRTFAAMDTDGDGSIDQAEAKHNAELTAKFKTVDGDRNDKIDQGEFAQFQEIESREGHPQ